MKRSQHIRLALIGGLSAGAFTGCTPSDQPVASAPVYTNDHPIAGLGYYHAPYRAFFPLPYNHFDPATKRYFHGGQWTDAPNQSPVNISSPPADTAAVAASEHQNHRTIHRSGFGRTGGSHWIGGG